MNYFEELLAFNRLVSDALSKKEALPVEEALRYVTSLAEALRRMHQSGVICGQLDPKHIEWGEGGAVAYPAPEQLRGETADARTDIFSFGAIVYELLTGSKAFPAQDPEDHKKEILESSPAPLTGVPEGISALVSRCLEKNREDRWQRMNSILIELKLASATARQAHSLSEWRERVASLRAAQEAANAELRQTIQCLEEKLDSQRVEIAALQRGAQVQAKTIEGIQVAALQTDEVVEHVVEAFGLVNRSLVERSDAKVLLVSQNGS
jgi:hypothetical protein